MAQRGPHISDEEARALWQRAAELQAAAERRKLPERMRGAQAHELSLADVAAAAEGAGIGSDYIRLALAERRLPDADALQRDRLGARVSRRIISPADFIEVERILVAPPARVLETVRHLVLQPAWAMALEDAVGDDMQADGVLTYRLSGNAPFHSELDFADVRVLLVTVRPVENGTLLRIRAPLYRRGINAALGSGAAALFGLGGWGGGSAAASALAGVVGASTAVLLLPAAIGALAGGALGLAGYRGLYNAIFRSGYNAVQKFLAAIELNAGTLLSGPGAESPP